MRKIECAYSLHSFYINAALHWATTHFKIPQLNNEFTQFRLVNKYSNYKGIQIFTLDQPIKTAIPHNKHKKKTRADATNNPGLRRNATDQTHTYKGSCDDWVAVPWVPHLLEYFHSATMKTRAALIWGIWRLPQCKTAWQRDSWSLAQ